MYPDLNLLVVLVLIVLGTVHFLWACMLREKMY